MAFADPRSLFSIGPFFESLLPDFILAFTFFTALVYAVLGKRFDHQRSAVAMAAAVGLVLASGLVWWEYQRGWSIRNLGPIAVGFAVMLLSMVMFQGIRQTGGSWADAGIAMGASILIAWVLGADWPIAPAVIQSLAIVGLLAGIIAFLPHRHVSSSGCRWVPAHVEPEIAVIPLLFPSVASCPSTSWLASHQALTMWMAKRLSALSKLWRSVLPSMAINRPLLALARTLIQFRKHRSS